MITPIKKSTLDAYRSNDRSRGRAACCRLSTASNPLLKPQNRDERLKFSTLRFPKFPILKRFRTVQVVLKRILKIEIRIETVTQVNFQCGSDGKWE